MTTLNDCALCVGNKLNVIVMDRPGVTPAGGYATAVLAALAAEGKPLCTSHIDKDGPLVLAEVASRFAGRVDILIIPDITFISRSHFSSVKFMKSTALNGTRMIAVWDEIDMDAFEPKGD